MLSTLILSIPPAAEAGRSRRSAARMRELTLSNAWPPPLRGANQALDRRLYHDNRTLRAHYHGKVAGQLAHSANKKGVA